MKNNNYTSTVDSLLDFDYNSLDVALDGQFVFLKMEIHILNNKSSSDMTLLIAIDTPGIAGEPTYTVIIVYSAQDINNIFGDNRENKLLIIED